MIASLTFLWHSAIPSIHDPYIIKWKHFPHHWPFVWGIPAQEFPQKGQWCWAFMYSLICTWINAWINNCEAGDLRCHHTHYDVTVMIYGIQLLSVHICVNYFTWIECLSEHFIWCLSKFKHVTTKRCNTNVTFLKPFFLLIPCQNQTWPLHFWHSSR